MSKLSIGIIGGGVLGRAIFRGFVEHADCRVYDTKPERSTVYHLADAATADIVFIALPTPALPDGRCDTLYIDDFLRTAFSEEWWKPGSCYCVRSTVNIGYTQSKAGEYLYSRPLFHSPEFLTARCANTDFQVPARNIIGSPSHPISGHWASAHERLCGLYAARFPGVPCLTMHSNASELVKLACNSFFAAKVTLFNLFSEIAQAAGVDWEQVRAGIMSDGRVAHAHTMVPGPDSRGGYGGQCLNKDSADLYRCAEAMGVDAGILREVIERNERTRGDDPGLTRVNLRD